MNQKTLKIALFQRYLLIAYLFVIYYNYCIRRKRAYASEDPFGRRLSKDVAGVKTYFLYSDEGLVAEIDGTENITKEYGWKPGGTWGSDPLFMKEGGQYYFYHNDHLGTPQKLTSITGAIVWAGLYTSFGECQVLPISTVENNLRFPGQYFDSETELHYNFHRYYEPKIGRYLRTDPLGYEDGVNLFSYGKNNPIINFDPSGEIIQILVNPTFWVIVGITIVIVHNVLNPPKPMPYPEWIDTDDFILSPPCYENRQKKKKRRKKAKENLKPHPETVQTDDVSKYKQNRKAPDACQVICIDHCVGGGWLVRSIACPLCAVCLYFNGFSG